MNVIAAINSIYTKTEWIIRHLNGGDEKLLNYGFSIEKIIILTEPTLNKIDHYNSENSSRDADKILEVKYYTKDERNKQKIMDQLPFYYIFVHFKSLLAKKIGHLIVWHIYLHFKHFTTVCLVWPM